MSPQKTIIVTAAIIVSPDGRILVSQRPNHCASAGKWEFPGGKLEPGESPRQALVRECKEELDIDVEVGDIYETIHVPKSEKSILLMFYLAKILSGVPTSMENNAFQWLTPGEMRHIDLLEPDRPLIDAFEETFPDYRAPKAK